MNVDLKKALVELDKDVVISEVKRRAEQEDPLGIMKECQEGMLEIGNRFEKGDYYLAELIISAEVFKEVAKILDPYLSQSNPGEPVGKVVLATLQADIHDMGKNILATLLKAQGFEVHDLGVDVPPEVVVTKVREIEPDLVGFSALVTSCFDPMKKAAEGLEEAGLRSKLKLMIGGGATNESTREYVGADFQTTDASAGVDYSVKAVKGEL